MFLRPKKLILLIAAVAVAWLPGSAVADISLETGWHSKYITQGRDNLDDGGVFTVELSAEPMAGVSVGAWFAVGDDEHYQETNLYAGIERQWGDFVLGAEYVWLHFHPTEGPGEKDDNELLAAVAYEGLEWATASAEYLHSTDADGGQLLVTLSGDDAITVGPVVLSPYASAAFDYGYSTKEHDGIDYLEAGITGSMPLSDTLALNFNLSHSIARADIDREAEGSGDDETWFGISIALDL